MTETSINYAKALYELSVPEEAVLETEKIFRSTPQLKGALENPLVSLKEKEHVIDRVFPQEMKNFLKVTCKYQKISSIYDILEAYGNYSRKQKGILKAVLTYVTKPEEAAYSPAPLQLHSASPYRKYGLRPVLCPGTL